MAIVADRNYRQTLTAALAYRQDAIQDLVFNNNPITRILRQRGAFKPFTGPEIRVPLVYDKLEGQWFTGYDKLNPQAKEILSSAVFTPKNLAVGFSLSGSEMRANEGRTRVIDLFEAYMDNAENSMMDLWEQGIHSDGTGDGGRQMVGFGGAIPIIPNAGTYGGIDRATQPLWRTSSFAVATDFPTIGTAWDATTARPILNDILMRRSRGTQYADVAIADYLSWQAIDASLVAHQRITRDDGGRPATLGFSGPRPLTFATAAGDLDVYCASGVGGEYMPENTIYGIDTKSVQVRYMEDYNMVPLFPGDGAQPVNQDAVAQYLLWVGELVLTNPRYSWRLDTTSA